MKKHSLFQNLILLPLTGSDLAAAFADINRVVPPFIGTEFHPDYQEQIKMLAKRYIAAKKLLRPEYLENLDRFNNEATAIYRQARHDFITISRILERKAADEISQSEEKPDS